jgi:hypothetical protein
MRSPDPPPSHPAVHLTISAVYGPMQRRIDRKRKWQAVVPSSALPLSNRGRANYVDIVFVTRLLPAVPLKPRRTATRIGPGQDGASERMFQGDH